MPNIKSAIKRTKTNNERRVHNATIKSAMRTAIKQVEASVANNEADTIVLYPYPRTRSCGTAGW